MTYITVTYLLHLLCLLSFLSIFAVSLSCHSVNSDFHLVGRPFGCLIPAEDNHVVFIPIVVGRRNFIVHYSERSGTL